MKYPALKFILSRFIESPMDVFRKFIRATVLPAIVLLTVNLFATAATFTVTKAEDTNDGICDADCSLREAVHVARTGAGDDIIEFLPALTTVSLSNEIEILVPSGSITISGRGADVLTIDGGPGTNRIFSTILATVIVSRVKLTGGNGIGGNRSGFGGAIHVDGGAVTLDSVFVTGNTTSSAGGGVNFEGGNHRVFNSTFSSNSAFNCGGVSSSATLVTIANSTISSNTASQIGGGLCANGNTTLRNVTVAKNTASSGAGLSKAATGTLNLGNTLVADNVGPEIFFVQHPGTIISAGNNLIGDEPGDSSNTGMTIAYQSSDIRDTPPMLGPLRNNGGALPTHALLFTLPAVDKGSNALAVDPATGISFLTDQRGFIRSGDGDADGTATVDIGAYESRAIIVQNVNDSGVGSLRQAITEAVSQGDSIVFAPGPFSTQQTITLTGGQLVIPQNSSLSINGAGAELLTINGNNQSRIFFVDTGAYFAINRITLSGGNGMGALFSDSGGAVFSREAAATIKDCVVTGNSTSSGAGRGGGVYNYRGSLAIISSTISNNSASHAGGLYNSDFGGSMNVVDSVIRDNTGAFAGGVENFGVATFKSVRFHGNAVSSAGGGLYMAGESLNVQDSTFSNNSASSGGGIYSVSGVSTFLRSTVSNNIASSEGGGILNADFSSLTLTGTAIQGNSANRGGGIRSSGPMSISGSTVSNNTSTLLGGGISNSAGLTIANSTISRNTSGGSSFGGGGIFSEINGAGTLSVTNSTIAFNRAASGGGLLNNIGTVSLRNTIVSNNTASGTGQDIQGALSSQGYNLISNTSGATITGTTTGNILGQDAGLDPQLKFNGGSTPTHALRVGSLAIDKGGSSTSADQRGRFRPVDFPAIPNAQGGNGADIGAFERQVFDVAVPPFFDFDGDGKTDLGIYRPNGGSGSEWWLQRSSNGSSFAVQFGAPTDRVAAADYTGDGKTDVAFWRPSNGFWYVLRSEDLTFYAFPFGANGDVPVPSDYDADGKADVGVFRPTDSTWYVQRSGDGGTTIQQFGVNGDVPVNADYDGDGKADFAIYRPSLGQWWLMRSTAGTIAYTFGAPTDKTVVGDYTGDGKADVAFWRPSTGEWYVLRSEDTSFFAFPFGVSTDTPVPGDYDGDGKQDAGVFRSSNNTWYIQRSTAGTLIQQFGATSDVPLPNAYVR